MGVRVERMYSTWSLLRVDVDDVDDVNWSTGKSMQ